MNKLFFLKKDREREKQYELIMWHQPNNIYVENVASDICPSCNYIQDDVCMTVYKHHQNLASFFFILGQIDHHVHCMYSQFRCVSWILLYEIN